MVKRKLAFDLIPLQFYFSHVFQKIVLNNKIKKYLFSTQLILHDLDRLDNELIY